MAALAPDQIDDLVELNYNSVLKWGSWTDISLPNQFYTVTSRFFKGRKLNTDSGPQMTWKAQVKGTQGTRLTGLFDKDRLNAPQNLMKTGSAKWAMLTTNYIYDVREDDFQSDDRTKIIRSINVREHAMYNEWFEFLESKFWTSPSSSTVDPMDILGLPHWVVKNSSTGFNGGNPSGWSSGAGGLSSTTYPKWSNWSGNYSVVSRDDLIQKVLNAMDYCNFKPPVAYNATTGEGQRYVFYTTHTVQEQALKYADTRNDNIRDIAGVASQGSPMLKGVPIDWVPELSNSGQPGYDSEDPFYGIDWNTIGMYFLRGKEMDRQGPRENAESIHVREVHVGSQLQVICTNRRSNFVIRRG